MAANGVTARDGHRPSARASARVKNPRQEARVSGGQTSDWRRPVVLGVLGLTVVALLLVSLRGVPDAPERKASEAPIAVTARASEAPIAVAASPVPCKPEVVYERVSHKPGPVGPEIEKLFSGERTLAMEAMGALESITACSHLKTKAIDDPGRELAIGLAGQCLACDQTRPEKCTWPTYKGGVHAAVSDIAKTEDHKRYMGHALVCEAVYDTREYDTKSPDVMIDDYASKPLSTWRSVQHFPHTLARLSIYKTYRIWDVAQLDKKDACDAKAPLLAEVASHWPQYVAAGGLDVFRPLEACMGSGQAEWCGPLKAAADQAVRSPEVYAAWDECRGLMSAAFHAHARLGWPHVHYTKDTTGGVAGVGLGPLEGRAARVLARRDHADASAAPELLAALDKQAHGCADGIVAAAGPEGEALRVSSKAAAAGGCAVPVPADADIIDAFLASALAWQLVNDIRMTGPEDMRLGFDSRDVAGLAGLWMAAYSNRVGPSRAAYHAAKLPVRFPIACPANPEYAAEIPFLEPVEPHSRNLVYSEVAAGALVSFTPYRVLPSLPTVRARPYRNRVLVDIGANGFFRSGKYLTDMYEPIFPFDRVVIVDPHPMELSNGYGERYNMTNLKRAVTIGMDEPVSDLSTVVEQAGISRDDFVVLKFDVDESNEGPTMEWGFVRQFLDSRLRWYVDELYIELHFAYKSKAEMQWGFDRHSMWESFDMFRQLRQCGVAVHSWP